MGGYGSGGHNKTHKTIEDYRRLDSFAFRRYIEIFDTDYPHEIYGPNFLCGGDIVYDGLNNIAEIRYGKGYAPLSLNWVGGIDGSRSRLYFLCPHCRRRVRYLYNYEGFFVCRQCIGANYRVQQYSTEGLKNIRRQMEKIVEVDLGYTHWRVHHPRGDITDLYWIPKPRYMRWEKYERLVTRYRGLQDDYYLRELYELRSLMPASLLRTFRGIM